MEPEKPQPATSNVFPAQPVYCPWTSRAPISNSGVFKSPQELSEKEKLERANKMPSEQPSTSFSQEPHPPHNGNFGSCGINGTSQRPSMQQSSTEFFHFLRLMQLFPDVHPATLHTVLSLCKNDFFCAVDKLLYAKRCKELYNSRRNLLQRYSQLRYQPYCCPENARHFANHSTTRSTCSASQTQDFSSKADTVNCQNHQVPNVNVSEGLIRSHKDSDGGGAKDMSRSLGTKVKTDDAASSSSQ